MPISTAERGVNDAFDATLHIERIGGAMRPLTAYMRGRVKRVIREHVGCACRACQRFCRRSLPPGTVSLWELVRR
jgi:hypothetical protein